MKEITQSIYKLLARKSYNRDEPYLKAEIQKNIDKFVNNNQSIKLVGFWGTGPKNNTNWADLQSCEFLLKLNNEIKQIYKPGLELTFIFATSHGLHNGYDRKVIFSYIKAMEKMFNKFGFKYLYLEDLWKKYDISFEKIDNIFNTKLKNWWNEVKNRKVIEHNAKNRNTKLSPKIAAQKYFIMRDLEKEMLKKEFSGFIFHAFSDSKLKNVLPNMPTLFFYARKGWSDTPWFVVEDKQ